MSWTTAPQVLRNKTLKGCIIAPPALVSYLVDGAVSPRDSLVLLTKATAGAYTLAAPTAAQDGHVITLTSTTAAAHVVTATGLLEDGVTGGAKDKGTYAAFKGASMQLMAVGGKWHTLSLKAVTVAAA